MELGENSPKSLRNPEEIRYRNSLLQKPHIQPLTLFIEKMRIEKGPDFLIPYFDPCDGGIFARVLFLLEAPGPQAIKSGFVSRNNNDETAKNMMMLLKDSGIQRKDSCSWNVIPWYLGDGKKIRPATQTDIDKGAPYLLQLLGLFTRLRVVTLVGKKAWKTEYLFKLSRYKVFKTFHPSPVPINTGTVSIQEILDSFITIAQYLDHSK
jgi:uracil-DNA glycosylase